MSGDVPEWLWVIHPAARDADDRIEVVVGVDEVDPEDFSADVQVIRDKDVRWSGTFYTLANLHWLFEKNAATGECAGGLFYKDTHAVIVRRLDRETIEATVAALVAEGEIE
jgi:hypothetical protein